MADTLEGLSRVTVVAPRTRMDLALPADVPLADLLPAVLQHAGTDPADEALDRGGWTLGRLGGAPLDTDRTAAQLDIRDGEVLYLTTRGHAPPEVVFDDVVDAVATATERRAGHWSTADTRWFGVGLGVAALAGGLPVMLFAGPPHLPGAATGAGVGLALLAVATLVSRLGGDSRVGALVGFTGLGYGAASGLLVLADSRDLAELAAPHLLLAATGLMGYGVLASLGVGDYPQVFLGASAAGVALGVGAGLSLALGVAPVVSAAVVGTLAFATMPAHPILSYRLARLPIPAIPTGPADLQADSATVDGRRVLAQADRAAELLTGLITTVAVVVLAAAVVLVLDGGVPAVLLATLLSVLLLLRARPVPGRWQRLAVLVGGSGGLVAVVLWLFHSAGTGTRLGLLLAGLIAVALASGGYGLAGGWRPSPVWGRLLDIAEVLLIVAVVPVAAWAAGVYGWVATLTG